MKNKGFTLVEVLIGLFIAVVASTYVAQTITSTNKVVAAGRDIFIATNLAHEGLDLTRAMRDATWFSDAASTEWMSKSGICEPDPSNTYTIDPEIVRDFTEHGSKVPDDSDKALYIQKNKLWTHEKVGSTTPTAYSRVLHVDCTNVNKTGTEPSFVTVTSTVSWKGQYEQDKSISIKEQLYNWWL